MSIIIKGLSYGKGQVYFKIIPPPTSSVTTTFLNFNDNTDIVTANNDCQQIYDIGGTGSTPTSFFFRNTGTEVFVLDDNGGLSRFTLSTPWDLTTLSFVERVATSGGPVANPYLTNGFFIDQTGQNVYIIYDTFSDHGILRFTLTSAWDVQTLTYAQSVSISFADYMHDLWFLPDGSAFIGLHGNIFKKHVVDTPWSVSAFTTVEQSQEIVNLTQFGSKGFEISPDGTVFTYVDANQPGLVSQAVTTSAYDLTNLAYVGHAVLDTYDPNDDELAKVMFGQSDRKKFFVLTRSINNIPSNFKLCSHTTTESGKVHRILGEVVTSGTTGLSFIYNSEPNPAGFVVHNQYAFYGNTNVSAYNGSDFGAYVHRVVLASAWTLENGVSNVGHFFVDPLGFEHGIEALEFKRTTGDRMFILDSLAPWNIWQYRLGGSWNPTVNVSSFQAKLHSSALSVSIPPPTEIKFRGDGGRIFLSTGNQIYILGTAGQWQLASSVSVFGSETFLELNFITSFTFTSDGMNIFVADGPEAKIYRYALSSPWDLATKSLTGSFAEESYIEGMEISPDNKTLALLIGPSRKIKFYKLN